MIKRSRPFSEVVPELLARHDATQEMLADWIGISESYLSHILSGERRLTESVIARTALALRVSPDTFTEYRILRIIGRLEDDQREVDRLFARYSPLVMSTAGVNEHEYGRMRRGLDLDQWSRPRDRLRPAA